MALERDGWSATRSGRFGPRKKPSTHCVGAWMGLEADLDGTENVPPTGIRSPDRPDQAKSHSLSLSLSQYIIFLSLRYAQLSTIIILPSLTYAKNKGRRFGCRAEQPNYLYTKSFTESKVKIMIQPNDDPLVGSPSEVASSQHVISVRRHN